MIGLRYSCWIKLSFLSFLALSWIQFPTSLTFAFQIPELEGFGNFFGDEKPQSKKAQPTTANDGDTPEDQKRSQTESDKKTASEKPRVKQNVGKLIDLQKDVETAQQLAAIEGRPLLAVFGADWCTWCRKLELELQEVEAESILKAWIVVKIDVDESPEFAEKHGVNSLPSLRVLDFQLNRVAGREGYLPTDQLKLWLDDQYAAANPAVQAVLYGTGLLSSEDIEQLIDLLADRAPKIRSAAQQRLLTSQRQTATSVVGLVEKGKLSQKLGAIQILTTWKAPTESLDPWTPESMTAERLEQLRNWLESLDRSEDNGLKSTPSVDSDPPTKASGGQNQTEEQKVIEQQAAEQEASELIDRLLRGNFDSDAIFSVDWKLPLAPKIRQMLATETLSDAQRVMLRELLFNALASSNTRLADAALIKSISGLKVESRRKGAEKLLARLSKADAGLLDELSVDVDSVIRELTVPVMQKCQLLKDPLRLTRLLSDKSPSVRIAALRSLSESATNDTVDALLEYMNRESDEDLLVFAAKTLGKLKLEKTRIALGSLLKHPSWRIRAAAVDSFAESVDRISSRYSDKSAVTNDDLLDSFMATLSDSDSFVASRAKAAIPNLLKGKDAEKLAYMAVKNETVTELLIAEQRLLQSSAGESLAKAASKYLLSDKEDEVVGAVRVVSTTQPLILLPFAEHLLDRSEPIRIATLQAVVRIWAEIRDKQLRDSWSSRFESSTDFDGGLALDDEVNLAKVQFDLWYDIPISFRSIPKDAAPAVRGELAKSGQSAAVTSQTDEIDRAVESFFGQTQKAGAAASQAADPQAEASREALSNNELASVDSQITNSESTESLDAVDDFFGSNSPRRTLVDGFDKKEIANRSEKSSRNEATRTEESSAEGLPSHWFEAHAQGELENLSGLSSSRGSTLRLQKKEVSSLREIRHKVVEQLQASESVGSPAPLYHWLQIAALACGELQPANSVTSRLVAESPVENSSVRASTSESSGQSTKRLVDRELATQLKSVISWLPGDQRLAVLKSQQLNLAQPTEAQKKLLDEATKTNHLTLALWFLEQAKQHRTDPQVLAEIQFYFLRGLLGDTQDFESSHDSLDWEFELIYALQVKLPSGYHAVVDWMQQQFELNTEPSIRAMLLASLTYIDCEFANQVALGYLAQASQYEEYLTNLAISLALGDRPKFGVDRAIQWLGHPVKEVRTAALLKLTTVDSDFRGKIGQALLARSRDMESFEGPGLVLARRPISADSLQELIKGDAEESWRAKVLLLLVDPNTTIDSAIDPDNKLASSAIAAAIVVKLGRSDKEVLNFVRQAANDFLASDAHTDESQAAFLKQFFAAIKKLRGPEYLQIRNELRAKFRQHLNF